MLCCILGTWAFLVFTLIISARDKIIVCKRKNGCPQKTKFNGKLEFFIHRHKISCAVLLLARINNIQAKEWIFDLETIDRAF